MKKLYYLIVLVLILGLALTGCTLLSNVGQVPTTEQSGITYLTKGSPGVPDVFTLYAGQTIPIGTVEVWDDTVNLYVRYVVNDPWRLTETHLHVATVPEDIPQTKKGNPIPGQFDYEGEHDCETYFLYTIPLADLNVELLIAAHAVVVDTETIETEVDLKWGRSFEDGSSIYSSLNLGDAVTYGLALPVNNVSQTVWDKNTWAYWTQYPVDNVSTYRFQVRHFQALFDLPKEIKPDNVEDLILFSPYDHFDKDNLPVNDIILINDNLYVYLNNIEIGRKGTCYPPASLDWYVSPDVGWYVPGSFSVDGPQNLIVGPNIIDIVAEESCGWGGMGQLGLKLIWHPEESAWAGKEPLPGDNWATYFTYVLQGVKVDLSPCPYNYPGPDYPPGEVFVIFYNSLGDGYNFEMIVYLIGVEPFTEYDIHLSVTDSGGWSPNKVETFESDGSGNYIFYMSDLLDPGEYTLGVVITLKGSGADIYETLGVHPPYVGDPVMIFY